MEKLLPALIVVLFAVNVNAQTPLTKELTCAEQSFTLRLDIRSGWHPGMVKIGSTQAANYAALPAQIDYLVLHYNIQKSSVFSSSSIFHADSVPGIDQGSLLFDKKRLSDFGSYNKPVYRYRDSVGFLHRYK